LAAGEAEDGNLAVSRIEPTPLALRDRVCTQIGGHKRGNKAGILSTGSGKNQGRSASPSRQQGKFCLKRGQKRLLRPEISKKQGFVHEFSMKKLAKRLVFT
jgi:hypothetical protein